MYKKGYRHSEEEKHRIGNANRGRKRPDLSEFNRTRTDLIGRIPWNKGLHGVCVGPKKGSIPWNLGRHWSDEVKKKISRSHMGKGKRKIPLVVSGWRSQRWSKDVIKKYGKCLACGSVVKLQAHHILPKSLFPEKMYDVDNGICLCKECHKKTDTYAKRLDLKMKL